MSRLRYSDLLKLSTNSLSQHKGRTALTLLGVILGAFLLVVSLSAGQGMQQAVKRTLSFKGQLKVIEVYRGAAGNTDDIPAEELEVKGEFGDERGERLRKQIVARWQMDHYYRPAHPMTDERLQEVESWDQVERVTPQIVMGAKVRIGNREQYAQFAARWSDNPLLPRLVVNGHELDDDSGREILMHEFLAYKLGYRTEQELNSLIGQPVQLELSSYLSRGVIDLLSFQPFSRDDAARDPAEQKQLEQSLKELSTHVDRLALPAELKNRLKELLLPEIPADDDRYLIVEDYTIAGLFRSPTEAELESHRDESQLGYSELILPMRTARNLVTRIPEQRERGYEHLQVTTDDELHVREVAERLETAGWQSYSQFEFIEMIQKHVVVITSIMATLALLALFVAALGTSNVMAMSVLERTHEIGIMKAVGAREGSIRAIFLVEGSLVGMAGGVIGVILGRLASVPGNSIARWIMAQRGFEEELEGTLFAYPLWIVLGVPALAAFMTMLAAYLPARRASRIDPIAALRHD